MYSVGIYCTYVWYTNRHTSKGLSLGIFSVVPKHGMARLTNSPAQCLDIDMFFKCCFVVLFVFLKGRFTTSQQTMYFWLKFFDFRAIFPRSFWYNTLPFGLFGWYGLVYDETNWGPGNRFRMAGFGTHVTPYILSCFLLDPWNTN